MHIGGADHIFSGDVRREALVCLKAAWPNAVVEVGDDPALGEIFVYRDPKALEDWERDGGTDENQDTMVYLLFGGETTTIVTGDWCNEFADAALKTKNDPL